MELEHQKCQKAKQFLRKKHSTPKARKNIWQNCNKLPIFLLILSILRKKHTCHQVAFMRKSQTFFRPPTPPLVCHFERVWRLSCFKISSLVSDPANCVYFCNLLNQFLVSRIWDLGEGRILMIEIKGNEMTLEVLCCLCFLKAIICLQYIWSPCWEPRRSY